MKRIVAAVAWLCLAFTSVVVEGTATGTAAAAVEMLDSLEKEMYLMEQEYLKEMGSVLDELQRLTNDMFTRWEQEDAKLDEICVLEPSSRTCDTETQIHAEKRRQDIDKAVAEFPQKKLYTIDKYLDEFFKLERKAYAIKQQIIEMSAHDESSNSKNGSSSSSSSPSSSSSSSSNIEVQQQLLLDEYEEVASEISETIGSLHEVVIGNVCFQFTGVSKPLDSSEFDDFNEALQKSMELAFLRVKKDVDVISVRFIAQEFLEDGDGVDTPPGLSAAQRQRYVDYKKDDLYKNNKDKEDDSPLITTLDQPKDDNKAPPPQDDVNDPKATAVKKQKKRKKGSSNKDSSSEDDRRLEGIRKAHKYLRTVVNHQAQQQQQQNNSSSSSSSSSSRMLSRNKSILNIAASAGTNCRCNTDSLISDVHHRNLQQDEQQEDEQQDEEILRMRSRMLFSTEFLSIVAKVLKAELSDVFEGCYAIKSFHCSEFSFL